MPEDKEPSDFGICFTLESDIDISAPSIEIYDPAEVYRQLRAEESESLWSEDDSRSQEESLWRRRLKALVSHPDSARRFSLVADEDMIQRIGALKQIAPHFNSIIDLVLRAAKISLFAQSPLLLPPLLLLGNPGVGKTFFARRLAEAIKTHLEYVSIDLLSDHGSLTGLSLSWKAARPGRIANALLASCSASPIILLDEVDKANPIHANEQPLAFLHQTLETESARNFADEYLTVPMKADMIIWILTANSVQSLSPSILDRLTIFEIQNPTLDQREAIIMGIYEHVNLRYNQTFADALGDDAIDKLLQTNPRQIRKILEVAFAFAHDDRRNFLTARDVENSLNLLDLNGLSQTFVGFI